MIGGGCGFLFDFLASAPLLLSESSPQTRAASAHFGQTIIWLWVAEVPADRQVICPQWPPSVAHRSQLWPKVDGLDIHPSAKKATLSTGNGRDPSLGTKDG